MCRMLKIACAVVAVLALAAPAEAGRLFRHRGGCSGGSCGSAQSSSSFQQSYSYQSAVVAPVAPACPQAAPTVCPKCGCPLECPKCHEKAMPKGAKAEVPDILIVVNEQRSRRGLRPFLRDDGLTAGAWACARYRATYRIRGHVQGGMGDFQFLPAGCNASAAGAGALEPSWGFQACCVDSTAQYAGAASVAGNDGLVYHTIFVRN